MTTVTGQPGVKVICEGEHSDPNVPAIGYLTLTDSRSAANVAACCKDCLVAFVHVWATDVDHDPFEFRPVGDSLVRLP